MMIGEECCILRRLAFLAVTVMRPHVEVSVTPCIIPQTFQRDRVFIIRANFNKQGCGQPIMG
jgi:hypothetical protein